MTRPDARTPEPRWMENGVIAAALVFMAGFVFIPHAIRYFFLFDDYAIVEHLRRIGTFDIVTLSGGFYRPAALLVLAGEARLFGWGHPEGYALVSVTLHLLNTILACGLLRRLGLGRRESVAAAVVFLASPWAGQATFWVSAQFDLLALLGCLGSLLLGLEAMERPGRDGTACLAGSFACAALAVFSKEVAVILPVLFLLLWVLTRRVRATTSPYRLAGALAGLVLVVLAYLFIRSRFLPVLEGPYGSFGELLQPRRIPANIWSYARSVLLLPTGLSGWPGHAIDGVNVLAWAGLLARAAWLDTRRTAILALGFCASLAPVLWVGIEPRSLGQGRFIYLPGFFACALLAAGLGKGWATGFAWERTAWAAVLAVSVLSIHHQRRMWGMATDLARSAIVGFESLLPADRPIHIRNLPFSFVGGPQILKSYAFGLYYGGRLGQPVRSDALLLRMEEGRIVIARKERDVFSEYEGRKDEREVTLSLPIVETPAP